MDGSRYSNRIGSGILVAFLLDTPEDKSLTIHQILRSDIIKIMQRHHWLKNDAFTFF